MNIVKGRTVVLTHLFVSRFGENGYKVMHFELNAGLFCAGIKKVFFVSLFSASEYPSDRYTQHTWCNTVDIMRNIMWH